jgi:hypothetical protein
MRRLGTFWPVVFIVLTLCAGILYLQDKIDHLEQKCGSTSTR